MTPLKNIQQTRKIKGHVLNENLRLKLQLDVIEYRVLLQYLLKTLTFRGVFLLFAKPDEEFYSFYTVFWPFLAFKGDQNTF